jgi:NADH-quinone oxidoreductase subunit J
VEWFFFLIFAGIGTYGAFRVITMRNVVHCALHLVLTFIAVGAIYVILAAEFLAAVQVLVYAGAIMVLFLFVILLIQVEHTSAMRQAHRQSPLAIGVALVLFAEIAYVMFRKVAAIGPAGKVTPELQAQVGNTELVGSALYTTYLFPFEVASLLLLAAMIGAIVLMKKEH